VMLLPFYEYQFEELDIAAKLSSVLLLSGGCVLPTMRPE